MCTDLLRLRPCVNSIAMSMKYLTTIKGLQPRFVVNRAVKGFHP